MIVVLASAAVLVLYLVYERISLDRWIRSVPLRITVTGTRGKSSVTRMIASVLREDGRKVLAKSSGSDARILLPDGAEIDVPRRGVTSIIEQKWFLKKAASMNADCAVAEVMSIHPENHYVESRQILRPHIVVITNVRPDHIDAMGDTEQDAAWTYSLDIPHASTVFTPQVESKPALRSSLVAAAGKLVEVQPRLAASILDRAPDLGRREYSEDLNLVYAVARHLGIDEGTTARGIETTQHDIGAFGIWEYRFDTPEKLYYVVNAFAANDPKSTLRAISRVREALPVASTDLVGILCLRPDRGDRTLQWIEALREGMSDYFNRIYVTGRHGRIVARRLKSAHVLKNRSPEIIMQSIAADTENGAVILGCGNIVGTGRQLVEFWNSKGTVYGL